MQSASRGVDFCFLSMAMIFVVRTLWPFYGLLMYPRHMFHLNSSWVFLSSTQDCLCREQLYKKRFLELVIFYFLQQSSARGWAWTGAGDWCQAKMIYDDNKKLTSGRRTWLTSPISSVNHHSGGWKMDCATNSSDISSKYGPLRYMSKAA